MRVMILGEGPHELGRQLEVSLSRDKLPALPRIVDRLMSSPQNAQYVPAKFARIPHTPLKASEAPMGSKQAIRHKLARKVQRALLIAKAKGCEAVVILIDRDRDRERIGVLAEGRDSLENWNACPACVVGTAVETFDAWMIADAKAIKNAGGDQAQDHPSPESLGGKEGSGKHPKDVAAGAFGTPKGTGLSEKYAVVAESVRLDLLEKSCPRGFKPFADEVRERILPVVSS